MSTKNHSFTSWQQRLVNSERHREEIEWTLNAIAGAIVTREADAGRRLRVGEDRGTGSADGQLRRCWFVARCVDRLSG